MKRTVLVRRTSLARIGALIPRQVARRAQKRTGPGAFTRGLVLQRDDHRCVVCSEPAAEIHHRVPRGAGGRSDPAINSPANLITVCRTHHRDIESWRTAAEALGYLVRHPTDPATVPVQIHGKGYMLLDDRGRRVTA